MQGRKIKQWIHVRVFCHLMKTMRAGGRRAFSLKITVFNIPLFLLALSDFVGVKTITAAIAR